MKKEKLVGKKCKLNWEGQYIDAIIQDVKDGWFGKKYQVVYKVNHIGERNYQTTEIDWFPESKVFL